jgi:hypothetical protein
MGGVALELILRMTLDSLPFVTNIRSALLTSEGRDRLLPLGTRLRLCLHRRFCKWCARYARQLDFLDKANHLFAAHLDQITGPSLDTDAKSRMKRTLQTAATRESRQAPLRDSLK